MINKWIQQDAIAIDDPVDLLVYQTRLVGSDDSLVIGGGGNTSLKTKEIDWRGDEIEVLRVKGTGANLINITRNQFPGLRLQDLKNLFDKSIMTDEEMVEYLDRSLIELDSGRPSIETLLHAFVPRISILHSHADAILSLTNNNQSRVNLKKVFGNDLGVVAYKRPGFLLSKEVGKAALKNDNLRGVILINHGLVTWGDTPKESYDSHIELVNRAEKFIEDNKSFSITNPYNSKNNKLNRNFVKIIAPVLRGLVSREERFILNFDNNDTILKFVNSDKGKLLSRLGAATPDHLLVTKRNPLWIDILEKHSPKEIYNSINTSINAFTRNYSNWFHRYNHYNVSMKTKEPRVVLIPGVGMWTLGKDAITASTVNKIYNHTISIINNSETIGSYKTLKPKDVYDAEYWPLEMYKLTLAPPEMELSRRIALVTGGASGIGRAIARRLAAAGAHVVVSDMDLPGAQLVANEIVSKHGSMKAVAIEMDVSKPIQVEKAFEELIYAYGGLDILVSNAGIARWGSMTDITQQDWNDSISINTTGHWLVAKEALKIMQPQGLGGSIVIIGTKNITSPGKEFGAYSVSKAAAGQLARVLALENGKYKIRVNTVNPDAVFKDSQLWSSEIREQRAEAHGIPVDEIEEFYVQRNLLKVNVSAEDVAETVLFLASDRSSRTTGAVIPVDGGLQ